MRINLGDLKDHDLIRLYPKIIKELRKRKIIRTKNIIGELGEFYALEIYKNKPGLPRIQHAPPNTKNVDALSINGERYAIKSSSTKQTGVFSSLSINDKAQMFEYLITIWFDKEYEIYQILECSWKIFVQHRKLKNPEQKWAITKTKKFVDDCKTIYEIN